MIVTRYSYHWDMYTAIRCACCGERTDRFGRCTNIECDE